MRFDSACNSLRVCRASRKTALCACPSLPVQPCVSAFLLPIGAPLPNSREGGAIKADSSCNAITCARRYSAYLADGCLREFAVEENDYINLARIRRLIDVDIKMTRCKLLFRANPEMVQITYDDDCDITQWRINPVERYSDTLLEERRRILKSLLPLYGRWGGISAVSALFSPFVDVDG